MLHIWAPWRSGYILGSDEAEEGCILCNRASAAPRDWERLLVLASSAHSFVMLNKYPYTGGHIMVVPKRHVSRPFELPHEEYEDLQEVLRRSINLLEEALKPHGLNVGMNLGRVAGAGIEDHIHWHVVPRWNGDTNFMPVLADVRVVSQSLEEVYRALAPRFADLAG